MPDRSLEEIMTETNLSSLTPQEKKRRRQEHNRLAARRSRKRIKMQLVTLSSQLEEKESEIDILKVELKEKNDILHRAYQRILELEQKLELTNFSEWDSMSPTFIEFL